MGVQRGTLGLQIANERLELLVLFDKALVDFTYVGVRKSHRMRIWFDCFGFIVWTRRRRKCRSLSYLEFA